MAWLGKFLPSMWETLHCTPINQAWRHAPLRTRKAKAGDPVVQGHSQLLSEFKVVLSCTEMKRKEKISDMQNINGTETHSFWGERREVCSLLLLEVLSCCMFLNVGIGHIYLRKAFG